LPPVAGKPVRVTFDGGQVTSDAGILLLAAVEQRLWIAGRLADCIEDPRAPERVRHTLAEMIRYRALLIAAGYPRACPGEGACEGFAVSGKTPQIGARGRQLSSREWRRRSAAKLWASPLWAVARLSRELRS
jgi:hypothetical protein